MKISSYLLLNGTPSFGLATDDGMLDVGDAFRARFPDLRSVLTEGALDVLQAAAGQGGTHDIEQLSLQPPITNPDKIICIGLNYLAHIRETGREIPEKPTIFTRFSSSLVGHGQNLCRPKVSAMFDFEGEFAFVIGKRGRHIAADQAMDLVAGYSCLNDGSIRDFQRHTSQFWAGKNFDHSGAMGPWLVTTEELPDPGALKMVTRLNGKVMQDASISDLAFGIPKLIAYLSTVTELLPGDVIATGTPSGVGAFRDPKVFMKAGDRIEIEITGIGTLANTVEDET